MENKQHKPKQNENKPEKKQTNEVAPKKRNKIIKPTSSKLKSFEKRSFSSFKKPFHKDGFKSGDKRDHRKDRSDFHKDKKPPFNQSNQPSSHNQTNTPSHFNKPKGFGSYQRPSFTGYEEKILKIKKISKTTKGGRNMRFSVLAVIGDLKGNVGFGIGKSIEVPVAIRKALKHAKNNMFKVIMNKNASLYHEVLGKHCAGKVMIKPAKKGTGIIAGGPIKAILELSGYKDVYSKNLGRNTPLNMIRATINGLLSQKSPKDFAFLRDKKLNEL